MAFLVIGTHFRALRTSGARKAVIFHESIYFCRDGKLILMVQVSRQSFLGGICSDWNTFSRIAGAVRVRSGIFFMNQFILPRW